MHIGASLCGRGIAPDASLTGAGGATPSCSWRARSSADGTLFGSGTISVPVDVSTADSRRLPAKSGANRS
jgi:hypothetical protein